MKPAVRVAVRLVLATLVLAATPYSRSADWGSIKGRVIFGEKTLPVLKPVPAVVAGPACAPFDPKYEILVVDEKTRGVRWVMVYLIPEGAGVLSINPDVEPCEKSVVVETVRCQFEPRVLGIWEGKQQLTFKNSEGIVPIALRIHGGKRNPDTANVIAPDDKLDVGGWKTIVLPVPISCALHQWMRGYIHVFDHPYYAVTNAKGEFEIKNAPVGKCRLVIWQEETGWVIGADEKATPSKKGRVIEIKKDVTTDLGEFKLRLRP